MRILHLTVGTAVSLVISAAVLADQAPGTFDSGCVKPTMSRMDMLPRTRPHGRRAPAWARNRDWGTERPARPSAPEWITERRERAALERPDMQRPERPSWAAERPLPSRPVIKRPELPAWASERPTPPPRPELQRPARPEWANREHRENTRFRPVTRFGRMPLEARRTRPYLRGPGWPGPRPGSGYHNDSRAATGGRTGAGPRFGGRSSNHAGAGYIRQRCRRCAEFRRPVRKHTARRGS